MESLLLALDFGGTKHTAGVASLTSARRRAAPGILEPAGPGDWLAHRRANAPPGSSGQTDLDIMLDLARVVIGSHQPISIGVSFGGPVDASTSTVRLSHHVPGWENTPLGEILETRFGAPALVDNDANTAALGEYIYGAGRGCNSLFYITVSTGVGGGWILDGRPWRGAGGMAGEIGHTSVDPQGPLCLCGKRGCVERFASGPYLAETIRLILKDNGGQPIFGKGAILLELANGDLSAITGQIISQAAVMGDELAQEVLDRAAWALGVGIGNAANLINPTRFVLGGGVTKSGDRFWEIVRREARRTALPEVRVEIVPALLGDDAPLWGAVVLAESLVPFD